MLKIVTIAFTEKVSGGTSPCGLTFHTLPSLIKGKQEGQTTVKLGDKEQIGVKEPFPVTKCQFTS